MFSIELLLLYYKVYLSMARSFSQKSFKIADCETKQNLPIPEFISWFTLHFGESFPNLSSPKKIFWQFETKNIDGSVRVLIRARNNYNPNSLLAQLGSTINDNLVIYAAFIDLIPINERLKIVIYLVETDAGSGLERLFKSIYNKWPDIDILLGYSILGIEPSKSISEIKDNSIKDNSIKEIEATSDWSKEPKSSIIKGIDFAESNARPEPHAKPIEYQLSVIELAKKYGVQRKSIIKWQRIVTYMNMGKSDDQIAEKLDINPRTVRHHKKLMEEMQFIKQETS